MAKKLLLSLSCLGWFACSAGPPSDFALGSSTAGATGNAGSSGASSAHGGATPSSGGAGFSSGGGLGTSNGGTSVAGSANGGNASGGSPNGGFQTTLGGGFASGGSDRTNGGASVAGGGRNSSGGTNGGAGHTASGGTNGGGTNGGITGSGGAHAGGGAAGTTGSAGSDPLNAPAQCTSNQHWTSGNNSMMRPGDACVNCHSNFEVAGTVYPSGHEPTNCNGVSGIDQGVSVVITDSTGKTSSIVVNAVGNFETSISIVPPFHAKVVSAGKERAMAAPQTNGNCNFCHTQTGANGAPGRIVQP